MPKRKASAIDALARHNDERRIMEDRGAELRRAAALELGLAVLDAAGESLSIGEVKQAIAAALRSPAATSRRSANATEERQDEGQIRRAKAASGEEVAHG